LENKSFYLTKTMKLKISGHTVLCLVRGFIWLVKFHLFWKGERGKAVKQSHVDYSITL